ncbi:unnamed protein product [Cochlearia groenlandica]
MGNHTSKKSDIKTGTHYTTQLSSYEEACKSDKDVRSFDACIQSRTNKVIRSLSTGVDARGLSFNCLKEVTGCLLETNQEVVKMILDCKKDIWKDLELFDLVDDYFKNSSKTLDFCAALEKALKKTKSTQLLINVALEEFEGEKRVQGNKLDHAMRLRLTKPNLNQAEYLGEENGYEKTLVELKNIKNAKCPFDEDFFDMFQSVYRQQTAMFEKLQISKKKLDKKIKLVHTWRKLCSVIFVATFATVFICSIVAAALAAPPVAAAMAAGATMPLGTMGTWIDSQWKNYEETLKAHRQAISSMQAETYVAVTDMNNMRGLIENLETGITGMVECAEDTVKREKVKTGIHEIKRKLKGFKKNVEELRIQAGLCRENINKAKSVIMQRMIDLPNKKDT